MWRGPRGPGLFLISKFFLCCKIIHDNDVSKVILIYWDWVASNSLHRWNSCTIFSLSLLVSTHQASSNHVRESMTQENLAPCLWTPFYCRRRLVWGGPSWPGTPRSSLERAKTGKRPGLCRPSIRTPSKCPSEESSWIPTPAGWEGTCHPNLLHLQKIKNGQV